MNHRLLLIAAAVTTVLIVFASGYGYHRDELYFLAAGEHLSWGYADQGPLTPLIARAMTEISAGSLVVLRLPAALAAGGTVLLTGLLARELGGGRRAEAIAAGCAAVAAIVVFTGHLLSTSTFDLLDWTAVTWLVVRAVRRNDDRLWPIAGAVLGVGLLNKPLPAFLALGMLAGVVIAGPRELLRSGWVWAAAVIAVAIWSPWLIWQAQHDWPQFDVSRSIAAGGSTSSEPRWSIVPFQLLLVSPLLAPVWIAGLVRLFRDPELRRLRFLAWAWVVLAGVFMASGGKPYYLAGLLPVLLAAGAAGVERWLDAAPGRARHGLLVAAIAISAAVTAVIALPVLPVRDANPVVAVNGDVGETIGWPSFARTVGGVYRRLAPPGKAVILTGNYGEAGAIDRYGPALGLPRAYSGHNAYWEWGPPPEVRAPIVTVGLDPAVLATGFRGCALAARIDNGAGIDNDEQGTQVFVCRARLRSWSQEWPALHELG